MALTPEGRAWAERQAPTSIVARVALGEEQGGWPPEYVAAAVKIANAQGIGRSPGPITLPVRRAW